MIASLTNRERAYSEFASVLDQSAYEPLPEDWLIGMTDIVHSTEVIGQGRYRDVNLAGVAIIAALGNALGTFDFPFTFGGDGAAFAVQAAARDMAEMALRQVAAYAERELGLEMRAGLMSLREIRANGHDVRIAPYAASRNVTYTMFSGGGIRWMEEQLKLGRIQSPWDGEGSADAPDLTGLSCDWAPFANTNGTILSLLVAPRTEESAAFTHLAKRIIEVFDCDPRNSIPLPQERPAQDPKSGRINAEIWTTAAQNSDFRKYDDALRLTVDCSLAQVETVRSMLQAAELRGEVTYGLHCQSHAIMTCFVPSSSPHAHRHFLDGMDGGYSMAAAMMRKAA